MGRAEKTVGSGQRIVRADLLIDPTGEVTRSQGVLRTHTHPAGAVRELHAVIGPTMLDHAEGRIRCWRPALRRRPGVTTDVTIAEPTTTAPPTAALRCMKRRRDRPSAAGGSSRTDPGRPRAPRVPARPPERRSDVPVAGSRSRPDPPWRFHRRLQRKLADATALRRVSLAARPVIHDQLVAHLLSDQIGGASPWKVTVHPFAHGSHSLFRCPLRSFLTQSFHDYEQALASGNCPPA